MFHNTNLNRIITDIMSAWTGVIFLALLGQAINSQDSREYCEWESFNATCSESEIILINSVKYGRMNLGRCVTKNYGHIGCGTDVTLDFDKECSGRRHCLIPVISLHNKRSCPKDFKSYLEAEFKCLPVAIGVSESCPAEGVVRLTNNSGHIASVSSWPGGMGKGHCPWLIEVEPHQQIVVRLVDFSLPPGSNAWYHRSASAGTCQQIAQISERNSSRENTTVCGGRKREAEVYISQGNVIEIRITASQQQFFLLKYEAFGCPPLQPPFNAWMETKGEHAVVQCNETDEAWYLTCKGRDWVGNVGNCSEPLPYVPQEEWGLSGVFGKVTNFPFGILIVVALGVAIGVAIGVMMLVAVLAYMKRRRLRKVRSRSNYILKQVGASTEEEQHGAKPNANSSNTDRSPMLIKREPIHDDETLSHGTLRSYHNTWHKQQRPLPIPRAPDSGICTDAEMDGVMLTPEPPSPGSTLSSVFTSFRPSHLQALESEFSGSNRNNYIVDGSADDGPYYFKVDPAVSLREHGGCRAKPDVVTGCNCHVTGQHQTLRR